MSCKENLKFHIGLRGVGFIPFRLFILQIGSGYNLYDVRLQRILLTCTVISVTTKAFDLPNNNCMEHFLPAIPNLVRKFRMLVRLSEKYKTIVPHQSSWFDIFSSRISYRCFALRSSLKSMLNIKSTTSCEKPYSFARSHIRCATSHCGAEIFPKRSSIK